MARRPQVDREILQMALAGYEHGKIKIDAAIASIRTRLGRPTGVVAATDRATPKRRTLSAAARMRIAAAQRKRWTALADAILQHVGVEVVKLRGQLSDWQLFLARHSAGR